MARRYYDAIFKKYKEYLEEKSSYSVKVFKSRNKSSTYFPIVTFEISDNTDAQRTQKNVDRYENYYFTINFYARDTIIDRENVAGQVIIDELIDLTEIFFMCLNMRKTLSRPTENLDTDVLRHTMQYECGISNRGNILRR